jgi:quercetin dioxygenase-like cupin family protein
VRERERRRTPVVFPENFEVTDTRLERITPGSAEPTRELAPGVSLLEFASSRLGAVGFSTGIARFERAAGLTVHSHECGKSITVLAGNCEIAVEGRVFDLCPFDSIHVPAGVAHALRNLSDSSVMLAHMAFSSSAVNYIPADDTPTKTASRRAAGAVALRRFSNAEEYELSSKAWFKDLFAKRLGAQGICGGYGRFAPGASLPCHTHLFDESITIVEGTASCLVAGRRYTLSGCDTALVPQGLPHRFLNESDCEMGMVWVYAGDEPERMIVESFRCSGGDSAS